MMCSARKIHIEIVHSSEVVLTLLLDDSTFCHQRLLFNKKEPKRKRDWMVNQGYVRYVDVSSINAWHCNGHNFQRGKKKSLCGISWYKQQFQFNLISSSSFSHTIFLSHSSICLLQNGSMPDYLIAKIYTLLKIHFSNMKSPQVCGRLLL